MEKLASPLSLKGQPRVILKLKSSVSFPRLKTTKAAIEGDTEGDRIDGGKGNDTIWLGGDRDIIVLARGNGIDTLAGCRGDACVAPTTVSRITKISFIPDLFTAGFAGLLFYLRQEDFCRWDGNLAIELIVVKAMIASESNGLNCGAGL